jgi:hypothetical protein
VSLSIDDATRTTWDSIALAVAVRIGA